MRFKNLKATLAVVSFSLFQISGSNAVQTDSIRLDSFNDFISGELEEVSISNLGEVRIGPTVETIAELEEDVIFDAAVADSGTIYISTGNEGTIYSIAAGQDPEILFTPPQILSHALAIGPDDAVYVGTSPNGRVYRIVPGQRPEVYFDPEEMYVWDLLFDDDGALFVATGSEAKIYRVPPNFQPGDEAEVWFTSDRSRITTLAFDREGKLLAGAGPKSYLYRINAQDDGEVLFNAGTDEIANIWASPAGDIYFSTLHRSGPPSGVTHVTALDLPMLLEQINKANGNGSNGEHHSNGNGAIEEEPPAPASAPSFLFRYGTDGFAEPVWSPGGSNIFSFISTEADHFLVGTDDDARLYEVDSMTNWSLTGQVPSGGQISRLLKKSDGSYLVFSSNPAAIYELSSKPADSGSLITESIDAGAVARWGRLLPSGNVEGISWQTRSGNASEPDETWSDWADTDNLAVISPHGRYLQVKMDFTDPVALLSELRAFYIFNNSAPVVNRINVLPVGLRVLKLAAPNKPPLNINVLTGKKEIPKSFGALPPPRMQVRSTGDEGFISFGWNAFDPNGDEMIFSFSLKGEGTETWALLASDIEEKVFSLNTRGMDDGYYRAKVTASDAPSNPPGEALEGSLISSRFLVDNTPPDITLESQDVSDSSATLSFKVEDAFSVIVSAFYILDGGKAKKVFPKNLLFDSTELLFEIVIDDIDPGEHTLVFQVEDESGNIATNQLSFNLE